VNCSQGITFVMLWDHDMAHGAARGRCRNSRCANDSAI